MKILRLELFGFKSFKEKTIISFDQPITAIVGSNGCGKSNVIDALYWVMGDMSAKHLRGTQMSDVIFSGSRDHAALDMAEVTLVLERDPETDPELPSQFQVSNEIQITRRYYRNGESEYLINRIQCRLRDIQEFFMDTGVGVKAYSIIEQGAIARLVTQKPEERRTVIEEVAGIMKFKARKAETERKIANARSNLQRIDDILKDLRKSLATLKAQATKAEKYRTFSDELRTLELRLASREWMSRSGDKVEAAQVVEKLRTEVSSNETSLEEFKLQLEEAELQLTQMEEDLSTARAATRQSEVAVKETEGLLGSLNTRKDALRQQVEGLEESLTEINEREITLASEIAQVEEELEALTARHEGSLEEVRAQEESLAESKERVRLESAELDRGRKELHEMELSQTRLTQELQGVQKALNSLTERHEQLKSQSENVKAEIENKQSAKSETLLALEEAFSTRSDLETMKNEVDHELVELENKKIELTQVRDSVREKLTEVRVRKEQLEALDQNMEGVDASSKALALHLRERGQDNCLLLDGIKIPSTFEKAVEAALGRNLERVRAHSFAEISELEDFIAQDDEIRSQPAHLWIPALTSLNARYSGGNAGQDSEQPQVHTHPLDTITVETTELASLANDGNGTEETHAQPLQAAAHFSELPGPDGLQSRVEEDLSTEFQVESKLPELKTLRSYLLSREDVIGPVSSVVSQEEESAEWLALLEDFWIVRSKESFASILLEVEALPINLVSLEGDVLWKSGFLDIAPLDPSATSESTSLVRRKREIEELRTKTTELEEELQIAQRYLDDCQASWNQAKNQFRELTAKLAALNPDVENLSTLLRQDEASLARLEEKTTMIAEEIQSNELESQSLSTEAETLLANIGKTNETQKEFELKVEEQEKVFNRATEELATIENELQEKQAALRTLEKELSTAETRRATLHQERDTSTTRKTQTESQLVSLEEQIRTSTTEIEEKLEEISALNLRFEEAQSAESELLEKVRESKASVKDLEVSFDNKNRETQRLVSDIKDLQQQMAIHDVELKNLSQKLAEQYSIEIEAMDPEELQELSTPLDTEELADPQTARERADELRKKIDRLGRINMVAVEEFDEKSQRYEFLFIQRQDVFDGVLQLEAAIDRIDRESRERFSEAYNAVNKAFQDTFPVLFGGGNAELRLTDPDNLLETGVEIVAQPPGKKLQSVTLLSGGEKALTAVSLIFGIFSIKPSPFCVLDEVDAPLDDANVGRFNKQIRNMSETSQIIMITHHKHTMESADAMFGVTMEVPGISKVASVELGELKS